MKVGYVEAYEDPLIAAAWNVYLKYTQIAGKIREQANLMVGDRYEKLNILARAHHSEGKEVLNNAIALTYGTGVTYVLTSGNGCKLSNGVVLKS